MSLPIFPSSREEILQKMQTDFIANIPESDPFLRNSWLKAMLIAIAEREFDIYNQINQSLLQLFPNTAEGIFAQQWGNLKGVSIKAASSATGYLSATGIASTIISQGTLWSNEASLQYEAQDTDYTIKDTSFDVESLIRNGNIVTVTTKDHHSLATGMDVTISNATNTGYNGTYSITSTGTKEFQYLITTTPLSPDPSNTILVTATYASILVQAIDLGVKTNLGNAAQITLVTAIPGVDDIAIVQFSEIGGGADDEAIIDYRNRYLEKYQNPESFWNEAYIIAIAKTIAGVTRVFVHRATPNPGDVTIYFMRDNDIDSIPSPSEVIQVRELLASLAPVELTIDTNIDGLIVNAPTPKTVDFIFTNMQPNTQSMKDEVAKNLDQFFKEFPEVGINIQSEIYRSRIYDTLDPNTGQFVQSFSLSQPVGNINVQPEEIAVLGKITI